MIGQVEKFNNHQYINVETFRKNGIGVKTPVWFAQDGDSIVVRTERTSGKMKRLRNNPKIMVAPCDSQGKLLGEWIEAQAEIISDEAEVNRVNTLVTQKYGFIKRMFDAMGKLRKSTYGAFRIYFDN